MGDSAPVSISLDGPLVAARFVARPHRFVVDAELDAGRRVTAHLADPGRLAELLLPGRRLWLRAATTGGRKTDYSAVLVESPDGAGLVSLDTVLPNRLVGRALERKALPELAAWRLERREFTVRSCRFDFLLSADDDSPPLLLEVKSVTLVEDGIGLFPDAVTARGTRHLDTLATLAAEGAWETALLFVAQRSDASRVVPATHIDPRFTLALERAAAAGVRVFARSCRVELDRITLGASLPVDVEAPSARGS